MIDLTAALWLLWPLVAFAPSPPKAPPPPPPPPSRSDAEIQAEKVQAATALRRRRGRSSQILAGERVPGGSVAGASGLAGSAAPALPGGGLTKLGG